MSNSEILFNIDSDGERVWVCIDGKAAGRFGRHSFDVYVPGEIGDNNLGRTFGAEETLLHAWVAFQTAMAQEHNVVVSDEHRPTKAG